MTSSPTPETVAAGLSEAQKNAIHWLDEEWFDPFQRDMKNLMWAVDVVLLRPAIIEHREVRDEGSPPAHQFRLTPLGLAVRAHLQGSPQ